MKKKIYVVILLTALMAVAMPLLLTQCGGGGSTPTATSTSTGTGKLAASVTLTGRASARTAAQTATTVDITIMVTGEYSETGEEFDPIVVEDTLDLSQGEAAVSVFDVPIGYNHILTVDADWGNGVIETVKAIVPEVMEAETEIVYADDMSTALVAVAVYYADTEGVDLTEITVDQLNEWSMNIAMLVGPTGDYSAVDPADVVAFVQPTCGDGTQETGEECDDGNLTTGDGCDDMCYLETTGTCGDGTLDAGEQCDDGNLTTGDGCDDMCYIEDVCGDGIIGTSEICDDGVNNGASGYCNNTCDGTVSCASTGGACAANSDCCTGTCKTLTTTSYTTMAVITSTTTSTTITPTSFTTWTPGTSTCTPTTITTPFTSCNPGPGHMTPGPGITNTITNFNTFSTPTTVINNSAPGPMTCQ